MWRAALFAALIAFAAAPAFAQDDEERITNYASDITVARNGTLTVTETIAVIATGDRIKHGIYRDFPTSYTSNGVTKVVGFEVERVTLDGSDEPYTTESIDSGERIKIGDADREVVPGAHTYTITYTTTRQIGFFDKYDELYWNVTGNFWIFGIDHASATIHLPPQAQIKQIAAYTGAAGDRGNGATAKVLSGHDIEFDTVAPLSENEGLTVAVGFNKGAVLPPTPAELRADFIRDNAGTVAAIAGVLILLIYYSVVWWEHGRDPRRGTIIPLFAPPAGFSPAAVRYIYGMAYDRKIFAAAIVDMAVKKFLKITQAGSTYTLTRTDTNDTADLSSDERKIASILLDGPGSSIELKQDNHTVIQQAISAVQTTLKNEDEKTYFVTNTGWFMGGVLILIVTGLAAALLSNVPGGVGALIVPFAGVVAILIFVAHWAVLGWRTVFTGPGSRAWNIFQALFMTVVAVLFVAGFGSGFFELKDAIPMGVLVALTTGGVAAYIFYFLLKAPTLLGAKIRDQIDGFKMFLNTAEKDRLEMLNPPQVTPEVFEKFLPYAIALDCENQWSKKFEAEAAAAAAAGNDSYGYAGYSPIWYSGGNFTSFNSGAFAAGLGASLAASAASAATAPGSSSGSGGGGFSGGGGGGGGGGGW
jgi:uncharacterized membrane protein YgcG